MVATFKTWFARKPLSDEEFVERIRQGLTRYRRMQPWLIGFYTCLAIMLVGLAVASLNLVAKLGQLANRQGPELIGFGVGLMLGQFLGLLVMQVVFGLVGAMMPCRTQELLIRYYDALAQQGHRVPEAEDSCPPSTPSTITRPSGSD